MQLIRHSHQFSQGRGVHLEHHAGPVNFDGLFAGAELDARLFVEPSRRNQLEYLAFAWRKKLVPSLKVVDLGARYPLVATAFGGAVNCFKQCFSIDGLL